MKTNFKTKKKKRKRSPLKKAKDNCWDACRFYIYERDKGRCFTCPATNLEGSSRHAGHFIPRSICGVNLYYDERNVMVQCMRCNRHLGGNGAIYYRNMVKKHGQEFVDELYKIKDNEDYRKSLEMKEQWKIKDYEEMTELYKKKLKDLIKEYGSPWK